MTSKEALEELESLCEIDIPTELYEPCIEAVKQDLEVLEILKKHLKVETDYCGDSEFKTHTTISLYWDNQKLSVDSKEDYCSDFERKEKKTK